MGQRDTEQINYTAVPYVCSGVVSTVIENSSATYEVQIYNSPIGEFNGPIYCVSIYSATCDNKYREGDTVKVLITFTFGGSDNKVIDMAPGTEAYILGNFDDQAIFNRRIENPLLPNTQDSIRYFNKRSNAGMSIDDSGSVIITSNGPSYTVYKSGGFGTVKNLNTTYAQNHLKVITNNPPFDTAREHFGMFTGDSEADEATRLTPDMSYIVKRSFVPATRSLTRWVSSCEGSFAPYVGPNNSSQKIDPSRETLFHKIIHSDLSRVTMEGGEPGDGFFQFRVDKVIMGEKYIDIGPGAITGILGNMFKVKIGDDGALELSGGSKGIPVVNMNGYKIKAGSDGTLSIQASKSLVLTTGDGEEAINSINISTDGAIDIKTSAGFTVNGQPLTTKAFLDWFVKYIPTMFVCTAPGSPAVPNPVAIAELMAKYPMPTITGQAMGTEGVPVPLPGIIMDPDPYKTV